jgi:hypothetical protein
MVVLTRFYCEISGVEVRYRGYFERVYDSPLSEAARGQILLRPEKENWDLLALANGQKERQGLPNPGTELDRDRCRWN